jgi:hypothetical protein
VTSVEEVGKLMLDRKAWRSRISMIMKENTSSNSGSCRIELRVVVVVVLVYLSSDQSLSFLGSRGKH